MFVNPAGLYVADYKRVVLLASNGSQLYEGTDGVAEVYDVFVGASGTIWVADNYPAQVMASSSNGTQMHLYEFDGIPTGIAVNEELGLIFAVDVGSRALPVLSKPTALLSISAPEATILPTH